VREETAAKLTSHKRRNPMNTPRTLALFATLAASAAVLNAAALEPIRQHCAISIGHKGGTLRLETGDHDCGGNHSCGNSMSDESMSRFTGITIADLARTGEHLTATLAAEAGTFTCTGTVADGALTGDALFTPDAAFVERMGRLGFTGFDSEKLMGYAFVGVRSDWAQSLQQIHIKGMTTDNLIALYIFKVDPAYVESVTALAYEQPDADQLVSLRVQGVDPEEVRQIRALGYKPTIDELVQIRIFKITPEFIHRMQDRGLKDLTIAKLVQIRIFKLAD
jgi:hypothetical protein